jgi:integrase
VTEIKRTADGQYRFVVDVESPDGRRKQVARKRPTKAEARVELKRVLGEAHTQRPTTVRNPRFGEYLTQRWLPAVEADPKLKASTIASYRSMSKHLVRELGDVRVRDLAGYHFTVMYGRLRARGLSERTVRFVHVTAHRAFKDAGRWRLVAYNPVDDADAPAQTRAEPRAWTPNDVSRFLQDADGDRWSALWRLAATTGMRRGELVALRWSDLEGADLVVRRNRVVVDHVVIEGTPKNSRSRRIALDPATLTALSRWRATQAEERLVIGQYWAGEDYLFTWPDGTVVHPDVISRTFKRLVHEAELPPLSLHNLRHAWATAALQAGVDVKVVAGRLGHSSTRITHDIYTAKVPSMDDAAARAVAAMYDQRNTS